MEWKLFADLAEITGARHIANENNSEDGTTIEDALEG
jgi:molybdopterin converting factor small subunit